MQILSKFLFVKSGLHTVASYAVVNVNANTVFPNNLLAKTCRSEIGD